MGGAINHVKALCSTYLKIKGVYLLKTLEFDCLKYTGENAEPSVCLEDTQRTRNRRMRVSNVPVVLSSK